MMMMARMTTKKASYGGTSPQDQRIVGGMIDGLIDGLILGIDAAFCVR